VVPGPSFSFVTLPYAHVLCSERKRDRERRRRRREKSQGLMHVRSRESEGKTRAAMCAWSCACVLCRPLSVCVGLGPVETCALAVAPSTRLCPCPPSLSQSCSPTVACVASECRAKAPASLCAVFCPMLAVGPTESAALRTADRPPNGQRCCCVSLYNIQ
jgi:hypothetical protein